MLNVEHDFVAVYTIGAEMANTALYDRLVLIGRSIHPAVARKFR